MKTCNKCRLPKDQSEFPKASPSARSRDGLKGWCKTCQNTYCRDRRRAKGESERLRARTQARRWGSTLRGRQLLLLRLARGRARRKGLDFAITIEDIPIPKTCPVLGIRLVFCGDRRYGTCPTLDRMDSTKGYVPGNVRVISGRANTIKSNASIDEIERVLAYMRGN